MTPNEFKAWFEGFTENMAEPPTEKQWARVKEQVGKLNTQPPMSLRGNPFTGVMNAAVN